MNNIVSYKASPSTAGTFAFVMGAALITAQVDWPEPETRNYIVNRAGSSYSPFISHMKIASASRNDVFADEIVSFYSALSEGQEPLGAEFEAIWDANVNSLYES